MDSIVQTVGSIALGCHGVVGARAWDAGGVDMVRRFIESNKQVERTATERCGFYLHRRQTAVVAIASALPVAVAHLGR